MATHGPGHTVRSITELAGDDADVGVGGEGMSYVGQWPPTLARVAIVATLRRFITSEKALQLPWPVPQRAQMSAQAMLARQQASAIVAARFKIVEGAVGMVQQALEQLRTQGMVDLDEERKAQMVANLLVVLCGERAAQPVLNTGTLYS
jgi:hypothetical protein